MYIKIISISLLILSVINADLASSASKQIPGIGNLLGSGDSGQTTQYKAATGTQSECNSYQGSKSKQLITINNNTYTYDSSLQKAFRRVYLDPKDPSGYVWYYDVWDVQPLSCVQGGPAPAGANASYTGSGTAKMSGTINYTCYLKATNQRNVACPFSTWSANAWFNQ